MSEEVILKMKREAIVAAPEGLHARPASEFVRAVKSSGKNVQVSANGRGPVSAASILSVLGLGVQQGQKVVLETVCDDAAAVLDKLVKLLEEAS